MLKSACSVPAYAFNHLGSALERLAFACFQANGCQVQAIICMPQASIWIVKAMTKICQASNGKPVVTARMYQAVTSCFKANMYMLQATTRILQAEAITG
jgi:hypothetical protein